MNKIWFLIMTGALAAFMLFFLPEVVIAIVILNALVALALAIIQIITVLTEPKKFTKNRSLRDYFVSIHVPCHNEPYRVVKRTLQSLSQLHYKNYEVIVIDNNTRDPKIWQPIRDYCKELGSKFVFLHFENLGGYKAGALNTALKHMSSKTEIIAIVDADYVVKKNFLSLGVPYFNEPSVAFVQYPQAYDNHGPATVGLEQEYRSFFDNVLEQANSWNAVTATGTLSLLRAKLFSSNDIKWNEWCITEDTEISMHVHGMGYRGIFLNQVIGQGFMPFNYYSLKRQRERWVHGNMQIIRKDLWSTMKNKHMNSKQKLSFVTQLTTWFHPNYIPIVFLILVLIFGSIKNVTPELIFIGWASLITILGFILAKTLYFLLGQMRRKTLSIGSLTKTVISHFGLTGTMSLTWLWAFTTPRLPFNRTAKDPSEDIMLYIPVDSAFVACLFISSILAGVLALNSINLLGWMTLGISFFLTFSILFLVRQTSAAKNIAHLLITQNNK